MNVFPPLLTFCPITQCVCLFVLNVFLMRLWGLSNSKRKLFLTCLEKSGRDHWLASPTEIEFSLFTRGRNVCCAQLFSSYHHSPQPPPYLSSLALREGPWLSGKSSGTTGVFHSPPLLKGQRWCQHKVGESPPPHTLSHHPLIITGHGEFLYQNAFWNWLGGDDGFEGKYK